MEWRGPSDYNDAIAGYWVARALRADAKPIDYRLAGLVYEYGVGGREPDPTKAAPWFHIDSESRRFARVRAALEQPRDETNLDIVANTERFQYNPRMFDEELRGHLQATVQSADEALKLGLSVEQKAALAQYIIDMFERLLSPAVSATAVANTLRLPGTAPERYAAREVNEQLGRKENIVEFLIRVYAKEIEAGLIEDANLSSLDRSAYHALHSWNSVHQDKPFHLIKKQEIIDREISERLEELRQAALQPVDSGPHVTREQLRQVRRLEGAIRSLLPE